MQDQFTSKKNLDIIMENIDQPSIAKEIQESIAPKVIEEKQVIVHCMFPASPFWGNMIRIWPTTVLIDKESCHECQLVHAENISIFPNWTEVHPMKDYWFTLVFTGLPKDCSRFDLKEVIPEEGGFFVPNIKRNATDIYRVKI